MLQPTPPHDNAETWRRQDVTQAVLDQIDVLYPVALRLTKSARSAEELTERTVVAALREHEGLLANQRSVKFAMLALLRQHHVSPAPDHFL